MPIGEWKGKAVTPPVKNLLSRSLHPVNDEQPHMAHEPRDFTCTALQRWPRRNAQALQMLVRITALQNVNVNVRHCGVNFDLLQPPARSGSSAHLNSHATRFPIELRDSVTG